MVGWTVDYLVGWLIGAFPAATLALSVVILGDVAVATTVLVDLVLTTPKYQWKWQTTSKYQQQIHTYKHTYT